MSRPQLTLLAGGLIVLAVIAAYANSLSGAWVFDDHAAIEDNPSIRHLADLPAVLAPPHGGGTTVEGRPILNLSLAVNYAMGGTSAGGYHAVNLLIHAAAALALFGLVRRILETRAFEPEAAAAFAGAAALLWAVHPLQTESVTYVVQRAESLMGLFYLLTLYGLVRGASGSRGWLVVSAACCWLGMGTKEVMVSGPLVALLLDRAFLAGNWRNALRLRGAYYAAIFAGSAALVVAALERGTRGGMAGFGIGVTPPAYWATQFHAVAHYLWLCFWPRTLVFDYGAQWSPGLAGVLPYAVIVATLAIATGVLLVRNRPAGFLGAGFFAILAPTSLIPGSRQTLAEHRMYLPLAAVVLVAMGLAQKLPRWVRIGIAAAVALGFLAATVRRNQVYRSELALFQDTVAKRPGNASAHDVLANRLRDAGRIDEAIAEYRAAVELRPDYSEAEYNLGLALAASGRSEEAIGHYEAALRVRPDDPEAHDNLGIALARGSRPADAERHLRRAVQLQPGYVEAHYNLAIVLAQSGRYPEAIAELRAALRLNAAFAPARDLLRRMGQAE